ncbi:AraC family transcriptional regulator [Chitinophaga sp.]|uniref:AraC family transcriptional regulator n=1 Tax=Chitinophaga sp. TaxID=1869181 RepID=UPI002F9305AA
MLQRYPKAFETIPAVKLHHAGKSVVAWFRLMDKHDREEGFLTENTLVFLLKGVKHIHLSDKDIVAHAGDLILLKRGAYFMTDYTTDGTDYQSLMLCTDDTLLRSFMNDDAGFSAPGHIPRQTPSAPMVIPCSPEVLQVRDTILSYLQQPNNNTGKLLELKIREVLLLMLSGPHQQAVLAFLFHMFDSSAESITLTIRYNLLQPFTLEEYAKMCGLSLSGFKREFSRLFHAPPKKWINEERLKHAQQLLLQTRKNVNEVADECGFENVSYFIKQYRLLYGTTPKNTQRTKSVIF